MKRKNLIRRMALAGMIAVISVSAAACTTGQNNENVSTAANEASQYDGKLEFDHSMELTYAKKFSVDYYKGGYKLIKAENNQDVLVVPENMKVPENIDSNTIVLQQPVTNMLVASTPAVSLFNSMGVLDRVSLTTQDKSAWYIDEVKASMDNGNIKYVGYETELDYEAVAASGSTFGIFSAMLDEAVRSKLDNLGMKVILDQSSYEEHPLARVEWGKLYGAIFGVEEKAEAHFEAQKKLVADIESKGSVQKSAAIFYISSKGDLCVRNTDDYMAKMIKLAGGNYIFDGKIGVGKTGNSKMEPEAFYEGAKDADEIIYIWSMGGKPSTLDDLVAKNPILADMKAVKSGNVWCTTPDYFQVSATIGNMINDINLMLNSDGSTEKFTYLYKLK